MKRKNKQINLDIIKEGRVEISIEFNSVEYSSSQSYLSPRRDKKKITSCLKVHLISANHHKVSERFALEKINTQKSPTKRCLAPRQKKRNKLKKLLSCTTYNESRKKRGKAMLILIAASSAVYVSRERRGEALSAAHLSY